MEHAVCKFIPMEGIKESIQILHFVYETDAAKKNITHNYYRIVLVSDGEGILRTPSCEERVGKGDIFFLFPNASYTIEAESENFKYMYITYMGIRAGEAMNKLNISSTNFLFRGFAHLIATWKTGVNLGDEVSQFSSEGVLLMTFAAIGNGILMPSNTQSRASKTVANIKRYIDDNFSDPDLSLEKISSELFYNKKYVSHVFKGEMKMGFSDYVNIVRIQHACVLIGRGVTSVKDVAAMCGFRDSLYFSKLFKQKMKLTPSEYMKK